LGQSTRKLSRVLLYQADAALSGWRRQNGVGSHASIDREVAVSFARVVEFEAVDHERIEALKKQIGEGERPEEIPASEIMVLHDAEAQKSLAILFFENEDDYKRGDAALSAMPAADTPGRRASVTKYDVAIRRTS
jgi:hypothetical protein